MRCVVLLVFLVCGIVLAIDPKAKDSPFLKRPNNVKYFEGMNIEIPRNFKRMSLFDLSFETHGQKISLTLQPYTDIFHSDVEFVMHHDVGKRTNYAFDTGMYYKGTVLGQNKEYHLPSVLAIEPEKNRITGFVHMDEDSFYIEAGEKYFGDDSPYTMAVYKWSNVQPETNFCGLHKHDNESEHDHDHDHDEREIPRPLLKRKDQSGNEHEQEAGKHENLEQHMFVSRQLTTCTISLVADSYFFGRA